jgi:hypothetical protein
MPYIKSNPKTNPLEIKEITEAMAGDWLSPNLLKAIEKSPLLLRLLQNPGFVQMTQELMQNPVHTFQKCQNERPEWLKALQEFSQILGDCFTEKSEEMEKQQPKLNDFEQSLVDKAMNDPKIVVCVIDKGSFW